MPAILLGRAERRSLSRLADGLGHCAEDDIPSDHAELFMTCGLLVRAGDGYSLTVRGQIEAVRQHFMLRPARPEPAHPKQDLLAFPLFRRRAA